MVGYIKPHSKPSGLIKKSTLFPKKNQNNPQLNDTSQSESFEHDPINPIGIKLDLFVKYVAKFIKF